jgi:hypothetical protein
VKKVETDSKIKDLSSEDKPEEIVENSAGNELV